MLLLACGLASAAESLRTPHLAVALQAETATVEPDRVLWLALHFELIPEWHLYWRNPGDSGEPPRLHWTLPPGWQAGEIHWPVPRRIQVGPLTNYGYDGDLTLMVPVRTAAMPPEGADAEITVDATWLVCREECIPEQGRLTLRLPPAAPGTPAGAGTDLAAARARWPVAFTGEVGYRLSEDATLELRLRQSDWGPSPITEAWFAADDWGPVAASGPQTWERDGDTLVVRAPLGEVPPPAGSALPGLLVLTTDSAAGPRTRGLTLVAAPGTASAALDTPGLGLGLAMLFALAGGLLLNLMPCVLPVLSIKVLGLIRHSGGSAARAHGLVFGAGVLSSLIALGGLLIGLRQGGAALGWGFQLQEPLVVTGLMYLMLALALNLSGVFTIGGGLAGLGQGLTERPGLVGTFATGVLAVVVASPCTAPFMGGALGFALTRPTAEALLVFTALGIGFALPVVLLSLRPGWVRHLPPPGPWMERLRNALAFPMYAAAAWLLWVLSQQVTATALAAALAGSLLLAFALWWHGLTLRRRCLQRLVALCGLGGAMALAALAALGPAAPDADAGPEAQAWSPQRVTELRGLGRPMLINFTAAWCITCKFNERVALDTAAVRAAMAEKGLAYLRGDWTRRDARITAELQRHGRSGVPLYLLYPRGGGTPRVLPQLLSEGLLLQAIADIHTEE